ncbi:hypothetical protein KKD19_02270 [Patescibacteria group bacterium]|nr:hypothetical protein [Patescibacteria group bacterium]MBU4512051.1 hypothetical protein [Patescibacteria group bacterium]MCG2693236.1 hypothetical protein [Candidatus Parcubacteria bacterium]
MFFYLYDSFLADKKYEKILHQVEARTTDLGVNGRIGKLNPLNNIRELTEDAIKWGAKTVVAVGNDKTISQLVDIIPRYPSVTLGVIPIGPENNIAKLLGIPSSELACDVLSNRLIDILDLGKINGQYFLTSIHADAKKVVLECDGHYKILPQPAAKQINICNLGCFFKQKINPKDGILQTIVASSPSGFRSFFKKPELLADSLFVAKSIQITSLPNEADENAEREASLVIDDYKTIKTPATIEVAPQKLKVIVGKERMF